MKHKLILYGCGKMGRDWLKRLGNDRVYCFADSNRDKVGQIVDGKEVVALKSFADLKDEIKIFISTSYEYKREIYNNIRAMGLEEQVVAHPFDNEDIYVSWDTCIDAGCTFEGRNSIGKGTSLCGCSLGYGTYIGRNCNFINVSIGRYSPIGPNVSVVMGQHPTRNFVSVHPMFYSTQQTIRKTFVGQNLFDEYRLTSNGYVVEIGNDVWIGSGVSIMEGVKIADGTIVAANANVVKDTEPYSIVAGNPAKVIRYRFNEEDINILRELQWWNKDEEWLRKNAPYFVDIKRLKEHLRNVGGGML